MRSFLLGEKTEVKTEPTARDYVQDGLQHNFDAIRNVSLDLPHQADASNVPDGQRRPVGRHPC